MGAMNTDIEREPRKDELPEGERHNELVCANCGAPNWAGAYFCKRCAVLLVDFCPRCCCRFAVRCQLL